MTFLDELREFSIDLRLMLDSAKVDNTQLAAVSGVDIDRVRGIGMRLVELTIRDMEDILQTLGLTESQWKYWHAKLRNVYVNGGIDKLGDYYFLNAKEGDNEKYLKDFAWDAIPDAQKESYRKAFDFVAELIATPDLAEEIMQQNESLGEDAQLAGAKIFTSILLHATKNYFKGTFELSDENGSSKAAAADDDDELIEYAESRGISSCRTRAGFAALSKATGYAEWLQEMAASPGTEYAAKNYGIERLALYHRLIYGPELGREWPGAVPTAGKNYLNRLALYYDVAAGTKQSAADMGVVLAKKTGLNEEMLTNWLHVKTGASPNKLTAQKLKEPENIKKLLNAMGIKQGTQPKLFKFEAERLKEALAAALVSAENKIHSGEVGPSAEKGVKISSGQPALVAMR